MFNCLDGCDKIVEFVKSLRTLLLVLEVVAWEYAFLSFNLRECFLFYRSIDCQKQIPKCNQTISSRIYSDGECILEQIFIRMYFIRTLRLNFVENIRSLKFKFYVVYARFTRFFL